MTKSWIESKGIWWAILTIGVGVATAFGFGQFAPTPETQQLLNAIILVIVGVVQAIIRWKTKQPIG